SWAIFTTSRRLALIICSRAFLSPFLMRSASSISSSGVSSFTCPISRKYNLIAVSPSYEERSRMATVATTSSARGIGTVSFGVSSAETGRRSAAFLLLRRAVLARTGFEGIRLTARCLDLAFAAINSCSTLVNRLGSASKLALGNSPEGQREEYFPRRKNNSRGLQQQQVVRTDMNGKRLTHPPNLLRVLLHSLDRGRRGKPQLVLFDFTQVTYVRDGRRERVVPVGAHFHRFRTEPHPHFLPD